jgi:hypothetical protein
MRALVRSEGDFFRAMRHVPVPGVDAIWNQIWPGRTADFAKLASSAAHLYGRPRAFSESFAAYRTRPTVEQAKWVIDQQFVRGINMLEVMFYPSSAHPRERSGWLVSETFPALAAYVHRAAYLLSLGRPTAQIALYYPTSSMWLGDEDADAATWQIAAQLLASQRDFDFADEQALGSLLDLEGGAFRNASGQRYRAVIVPPVVAVPRAVLERLAAFARAGGVVVWMGCDPVLVVGRTFLHASERVDPQWTVRAPGDTLTPGILDGLPPPDVHLDPPCPAVKVLHRRWRDADLYYAFNESEETLSFSATLAGSGPAQVWDARTGTIHALPHTAAPAHVRVSLSLPPYGSTFIHVRGA